jgi:acetamidase/formamidase
MHITHYLPCSPETIHWGFFDASLAPQLTVQSGDIVKIDTVNGQIRGIGELKLLPEHEQILAQCSPKLGPHIITGPIAVAGAEPGDVLEVRVLDVQLRLNWGWNAMRPLRGTLPKDFPITQVLHIPIDREKMTATLPFGPTVELHPFFGIMGVAPPPVYGALSSIEPREHGGNIDNKELGVGSTVFFPVHAPGALFSVGDGHGVQGDGEVDLSALETSLTGVFQLILHRQVDLTLPMAATATHLIAMGFDEDLDEAARIALQQMIKLLTTLTDWKPSEAYAFCSLACVMHITQLVDGQKGVHAMVQRHHIAPLISKTYLGLA